MRIQTVFSQIGYPGAGDVDDCFVVATIWAAIQSGQTFKPTVPYFRMKANRPDLPGATGGNIWRVYQGAQGCWPDIAPKLILWRSTNWSSTRAVMKAHPASVGLHSGHLPTRLQFRFKGLHQVGIVWDGTQFLCANPLAAEGSKPLRISETELKTAMGKLLPAAFAEYRAVLFPPQSTAASWAPDIAPDIKAAYKAATVAAKLRALGLSVARTGTVLHYSDLVLGLRQRHIDFGSSVQLRDVRALMKAGIG